MTWAEVRRRLSGRPEGDTYLYDLLGGIEFITAIKWLNVLSQLQRIGIRPPNSIQRYGWEVVELTWSLKSVRRETDWTVMIDWDGRVGIHRGEVTLGLLDGTRHKPRGTRL